MLYLKYSNCLSFRNVNTSRICQISVRLSAYKVVNKVVVEMSDKV